MQLIKKGLLVAFSMLLTITILTGCGDDKKKETEDKKAATAEAGTPLPTDSKKVIAEYKGGKVTEGELNHYLNIIGFFQPQMATMMNNPDMKKQVLNQYIAEQVVLSKVKEDPKYEKEATKSYKELEKQITQMPAQGDQKKQDMKTMLKEKGLTEAQLKEYLKANSKVKTYFENQITEAEMKKEYEKSDAYDKVKLNHVLVAIEPQKEEGTPGKKRSDAEAKKRAEEVKKKLAGGASFKEIAKKYSDDPGSKENGGEYEASPANWVPEFAKAAKELPLNKISDPVKTEYGYHVMKVLERGKEPYNKVKEQIRGQMVSDKYQAFMEKEVKITKLNLPEAKEEEKKEKK